MNMNMNMNMQSTPFRQRYWDSNVQLHLELPEFFRLHAADGRFEWEELPIPDFPGPDETRRELDELLHKQSLREERQHRKDDIERESRNELPYFGRALVSNPTSFPATYKIMNMMLLIGSIVVMHYKNKFNRPRPSQLEPKLRPMLEVPGHPAYPSGHATQAHLIALALDTLVQDLESGEEMHKVARDIAENREWASLHYASDSAAGEQLARFVFPMVWDTYEANFRTAEEEWS